MTDLPENLKQIEKRWKGKKVYIVGDHPHAGEIGECLKIDILATGKAGMKIKGESTEFYVFSAQNLHLLP